jgi:uncharacterized protein YndB with AHSA1/START domain
MGTTMSKTEITAATALPLVVVTREFAAPRDLVFRAHIEPELLAQWLGPRELTTTVDRHEARDGGRWRYLHTDREGNTFAFRGVFHGDPSPDAIVRTFEYEGVPGRVQLDATTLEDRGGATFVRTVSAFQSVADRDAMVAEGMEYGLRDGAERLEELLTTLREGTVS